jgi:peptidoglycan/LPS O-acetylase OafA/YrhL
MVLNKESNMSGGKLNSFNSLCLVLALIVLIGHSGLISGNYFSFTVGKIRLESLAVYCFFIISGYLITPGLQQGGVRNYMIRRCIRIYPAYVGVIAAVGFGFSILWEYLSSDNSISIFYSIRYFFLNIIPLPGLFNQQYWNVNFFGGQPIAVPVKGISNGSLWSLTLESIVYVSLVVLFSFSQK